MRSKPVFLILIGLMFALVSTIAPADDHGRGHGRGHERHEDRDDDDRGGHGYSDHDRDVMRGWYREQHGHGHAYGHRDHYPPGLEKRLVVHAVLPVTLREEIRPCPYELERQLPPPPPQYEHAVIGTHVVLMNRKTFFVVDVFHLEQ